MDTADKLCLDFWVEEGFAETLTSSRSVLHVLGVKMWLCPLRVKQFCYVVAKPSHLKCFKNSCYSILESHARDRHNNALFHLCSWKLVPWILATFCRMRMFAKLLKCNIVWQLFVMWRNKVNREEQEWNTDRQKKSKDPSAVISHGVRENEVLWFSRNFVLSNGCICKYT